MNGWQGLLGAVGVVVFAITWAAYHANRTPKDGEEETVIKRMGQQGGLYGTLIMISPFILVAVGALFD